MMRTVAAWVVLGGVLLGAAAAQADRVLLHDGSVREGKVLSQGDDGVSLKIERDGISSTVLIPAANVDRVEISHAQPTTRPAVAPTTPATITATTHPTTQPTTQAARPAKPGHLLSAMWQLATGRRPDWSDPATLPEDQRPLWKKVVTASETGRPEEALSAMLALDDALRSQPGRIDALARRYKGTWFGPWLAGVRWETWKDHAKGGGGGGAIFDVKDVTDAEKPTLIGILRTHTAEVLEPLKQYMPLPPAKVGPTVGTVGTRVKPVDPIMTLTLENPSEVLKVKDEATLARAVLVAQLKLEPAMPAVDKAFLSQQLADVQRIFGRAGALEGEARAKLKKLKP